MRHDHYKTSDDRYYAAPDQRGGGHGPSSRHQRPALPPEGPVLTAKVKWFNVFKGFGFVECFTEENAYIGDAFLPADALADIGRDAVRKDDQLKLYVRETDKGHKVTHVVSIEEAPASSETSATAASPDLVDLSSGDILEGVVKWYDADIKRYGFIAMDDGGKDVFIHSSVLERSQIYQLVEGQRIRVRVIMGRKGREAILIESLV
jgi:CspA family cold shock protein